EQDVAADDEALTVHDPDPASAAKPELAGDRVLDHLLHEETSGLRHAERLGHSAGHQQEIDPVPASVAFHDELSAGLPGDGEADPFTAAGPGDVVTDDADQLPPRGEDRAAGIASVDGGRGLEELGEREVRV